jgi:hypothetical protein
VVGQFYLRSQERHFALLISVTGLRFSLLYSSYLCGGQFYLRSQERHFSLLISVTGLRFSLLYSYFLCGGTVLSKIAGKTFFSTHLCERAAVFSTHLCERAAVFSTHLCERAAVFSTVQFLSVWGTVLSKISGQTVFSNHSCAGLSVSGPYL